MKKEKSKYFQTWIQNNKTEEDRYILIEQPDIQKHLAPEFHREMLP